MSANPSNTAPLPVELQNARLPALRPQPALGASLTTPQKAALVIAALGPELAGPIIERIDEKHLRAFARAYAQMQKIPKAALTAVVEEFVDSLAKDESVIEGGYAAARDLLGNFVDSDNMMRLMDEIDVPGGQTVWEKFERAGDEAAAEYLSRQSPQLSAVALSRINVEMASRLLDMFEAELAGKVVLRLTQPIDVKAGALRILEDTLERDFLAPLRKTSEKHNPGEMVGAMMNNVGSKKRETLLSVISSSAPDVMNDVRKSMLTFEDLATRAPANAIPMVIKGMEAEVFLQAAKYGKENAPECVEFIFANISQRMAQQYKEQMEELPDIPVEEAEAAQAAFMTVLRGLVKSGEVKLVEVKEDASDEKSEAAGPADA